MDPLAAAVSLNLGQQSIGLMGAAAVALYVAGRAAADATTAGRPLSAGRLALGHWLPIAVVSAVAAFMGQFAVAVGIVFATAIGCLSLGVGTLGVVTQWAVVPPAAARRTWPLLVPAGLLPLVAGFHRELGWKSAVALAVEGLCVLAVWTDRPAGEGASAAAGPEPVVPTGLVPATLRPVQLALAGLLSAVGAGLAVLALSRSSSAAEAATPGLLTATVLAPLAVLPALGSVADWANRGPVAAGRAASALVGMALLDACGGLPIAAAAAWGRAKLVAALSVNPELLGHWHGWPRWLGVAASGVAASGVAASGVVATADPVSPLVPFPVAVWRVDLVAFVALSAALVPVALGRFPIARGYGAGLIAAYAAYLFLSLKVGVGGG